MNQDGHSLRRRWGAFTVLTAAAAAASAAAMILATPAFADPTDDAVGAAVQTTGGGGGTETLEQQVDGLLSTDLGNGATFNLDEAALNSALGGVNATEAMNAENILIAHPGDVEGLIRADNLVDFLASFDPRLEANLPDALAGADTLFLDVLTGTPLPFP
jgi:hypothetical protein